MIETIKAIWVEESLWIRSREFKASDYARRLQLLCMQENFLYNRIVLQAE